MWAVIADALFNSIDVHGAGLDLASPTETHWCKRNKDGYVDNTLLVVDGRDNRVVNRLTVAAQRHERTLFATGEKLALHKCTWVLVNWAWTHGKATMTTTKEWDHHSMVKFLLQQRKTGDKVEIRRLNPSNAY